MIFKELRTIKFECSSLLNPRVIQENRRNIFKKQFCRKASIFHDRVENLFKFFWAQSEKKTFHFFQLVSFLYVKITKLT